MAQLLSPEQEAFRDLQEPSLLIFLPGTLPVRSREPLVRFRCSHLLGDRISLFPPVGLPLSFIAVLKPLCSPIGSPFVSPLKNPIF